MKLTNVPACCVDCNGIYFRPSNPRIYIRGSFCSKCRSMVPVKQWKLLNRTNKFLREIEVDSNYTLWNKYNITTLDLIKARAIIIKTMFSSFKKKLTRPELVFLFQSQNISVLFADRALELIEIYEEYDTVIKEINNG